MRNRILKWLLRNELDQLWSTQSSQDKRLADLEKQIVGMTNLLEDQSKEHLRAIQILLGLVEFLGVRYEIELEPDPSFMQPRPKLREVVRVYKK